MEITLEEKKYLSLLRYALKKRNYPENKYFLGLLKDVRKHHDTHCLVKGDQGEWMVLYTERGNLFDIVVHPSLQDAITDLYWKLVRKDGPYDYRDEWEIATGLSF